MINVDVKELKIGMYVSNLDRPWLGTPFLFQGFLIKNNKQIEQLQSLCQSVQIDEDKSDSSLELNIPKSSAVQLNDEIIKQAEKVKEKPFEEEISIAREVYENTSVFLHKVLEDFRLGKEINSEELEACVKWVVEGVVHNAHALTLLTNLKLKHLNTVNHSINVCILSLLFGRFLGFSQQELSDLGFAALLHDVGEIKVPQEILSKSNRSLTPEEKAQMEKHTIYGAEILKDNPDIPDIAAEVAYSHHERINGKGYPRKLKGSDIHEFAKLVAIVDVYETVTNYPNALIHVSSSDALKSIYSMRDTFFDRELVEKFIKCLGIYPIGSVIRLNTEDIGIVIKITPGKNLLPTIMLIRNGEGDNLYPPRVINLDHFKNEDGSPQFFIVKVLEPSAFGINLSDYLIRETNFKMG